jgi:high affinity Mn2+ porin
MYFDGAHIEPAGNPVPMTPWLHHPPRSSVHVRAASAVALTLFGILSAFKPHVAAAADELASQTGASAPIRIAQAAPGATGDSNGVSAADSAAGAPEASDWSLHWQATGVYQGNLRFTSPYQGPNSLDPGNRWRETVTTTAYLGRRLWDGAELYFNPEFDQGFGLSKTVGLAGFANGEAQKAGANIPKFNVARLFLRQTFDLGGESEQLPDDLNQMAGPHTASRLTVTAGKFSVTDIFDDNKYAHDPRTTFLNWAIWEAGAFDYPADQKGFTDGVAVELNRPAWAARAGFFLEPKRSNDRNLDTDVLKRGGLVSELELRHGLVAGQQGKVKILGWVNRAYAGGFRDTLDLDTTDITATRKDRLKYGFVLNVEQPLADDFGMFSRLSWNDGRSENMSFTDIDASLSLGASLKGVRWGRADDVVALGAAVNRLSNAQRDFTAAGGLGVLIGDGRLSYASEGVVEAYYSLALLPDSAAALSVDYQFIANPAYNSDRGPVSIFAARLHTQF